MNDRISAKEFQKQYGHLKTLRGGSKSNIQEQKTPKYSNVSGWWTNGTNVYYMRSMMESNFAWFLETLTSIGEIRDWTYEPKPAFEFPTRANNTYLPDFQIWTKDGETIFYEVKGYLDSRSKIKLNRMKKYHPLVNIEIIDKKKMSLIKEQFKSLVKNWGKPLLSKKELSEYGKDTQQ
jgi:hypothetical protein